MGGFRAKDADRERYVEVIESAYVDGQLGEQDRELRVSRALTAETLDELDALTRDLQNQPAAVVVHPPPAPRVVEPAPPAVPPRVVPARPAWQSEAGPLKVVWIAVVAVFAAVVLGMVSSAQDDMSPFGSETDYSTIPWDEIDHVAPAEASFRMRAADVRAMVSAYDAQFGSLEAYAVDFYPRRVVVEVPVGARGQRFERWSWDGAWTRTADAVPVEGTRATVDLGTIAPRPLVENVATATEALRVEQGRFDRAALSRSGGDPAVVTITVTNRFNESGSLTTTPAGEILGRQPYVR